MKNTFVFLVICVLLAIVADRPPPAEAFRPATGIVLARKDDPPAPADRGEIITWGERWYITAYCPCEACCGRWANYHGGGWTASGVRARAGETVAVDPTVVPLGSRVWIEGLGWRIAQDTGSAVRGRHVDVFMETHKAAAAFGVQRRMVLVMKVG